MRVALYPRVSTQEQAREGYSIGEQIERLTKYCQAMQWDAHKIYTDAGYSGANTNRPGLQEMIKDVKAGKIDKVVVYKLDRLSRSQLDTLYLIEKVFLANGVDFVSMSENFDTSTPFGRAMIGILAVFAQLDREQIRERMSVGKEGRAKDGLFHGSKFIPIGYDYENGQLVINEYEKMQIKELYDLFLRGTLLRTIETIFMRKGYRHKHGFWNPKSMRRVMRSKTILGYIKHHDEWYKGQHDPIIDENTFNKAIELLDMRAEQYKLTGVKPGFNTSYLGGMIICAHCGGKYSKQRGGSNKYGILYYYTCYSRSKKVKGMIKDPNCKNKNYRMEKLDNIIFDEIKKLAIDPDYINEIRHEKNKNSNTPNKIEIINEEIKKIDTQISRLMDLYSLGNLSIEAIGAKIDPLVENKKKLENELEILNAESGELSTEETIQIVSTFGDVFERGDFNEIRSIIESLIYYIEIDDDNITIHWKFT